YSKCSLGETIKQAGAAGAYQILLTATTRRMCGIPRVRIVSASLLIMMTDTCAAIARARPIVASHRAGNCPAVGIGARQHVMCIRFARAAVPLCPFFRKGFFLPQLLLIASQVIDIWRNDNPLRILPGSAPDPIAGIPSGLVSGCPCAQICPPRFVTG